MLPEVKIKLSQVVGYSFNECPIIKFVYIKKQEYLLSVSGKLLVMTNVLNFQDQIILSYHKNQIRVFDYQD